MKFTMQVAEDNQMQPDDFAPPTDIWDRPQVDPLSLDAMLEAADAVDEDLCDCGGETKLPGYKVGRDCL